jgi:hypothetical protein
MKNQFSCPVRHIRTNNEQEFLSHRIQQFFDNEGIIHERTYVETPQQNGVVERKHQHLLNVAWCLRFQAHLPVSFWGECILTITYLINRITSPSLENKSPHELLFNTPPEYHHLQVFGYLCYAQTLCSSRDKFSPRASKCIFLGYPFGHKAYRVYDLTTKKIFISRDVILLRMFSHFNIILLLQMHLLSLYSLWIFLSLCLTHLLEPLQHPFLPLVPPTQVTHLVLLHRLCLHPHHHPSPLSLHAPSLNLPI